MASTVGSRLAYDKAKEAINRAGFSAGQAVLSQGYLRLEVALSTTQTLYTFPILQNDNLNGQSFKTENRLALQDAFYVSSMGLFFTGDTTGASDTTMKLYTYPDPLDLATSASSLRTWYNSSMSLVVNNRQILPSYDLYRHYWAGQTQSSATTVNQQDGSSSAFYPVEPGWVIVGSKNNALQVSLGAAMTATEKDQRAVIIFRGHLAQNVTPVR